MRRESPAGACYPQIKKGHAIGKPPVFWKRPVTFRGMTGPCPGWVIRVVLTAHPPLRAYPD